MNGLIVIDSPRYCGLAYLHSIMGGVGGGEVINGLTAAP